MGKVEATAEGFVEVSGRMEDVVNMVDVVETEATTAKGFA